MLLTFGFLSLVSIFNVWFFQNEILSSGDWMYFFVENQRQLLTLPHLWNNSGLGQMDIGLMMYPVTVLWGALSPFGFGFSERLLYLIPSVIGTYFGSYLLIQYFFENKYARFIGCLLYTLNTYFMVVRTGHLTLMVGFALAPFILYFFHKFLDSWFYKYLICSILIGIIASYYEFRAFYLISIIIFLLCLYSYIITKTVSFKKFIQVLFIYFSPILLANLYWILPFKFTHFFTTNNITIRGLFGNEYMRIDRAFGLFHPFWSGKLMTAFQIETMPIYMWIIPVVAVLGMYVYRKNTTVIFYGFIALLGVFLTKQSNPPFEGIYGWIFFHIPGFNAFREASKFYFFIALGYSVLVSASIDWIFKLKSKNVKFYFVKYLLPLTLGIIFIWNTRPILTGEIGTLFTPRKIPIDYYSLKEEISKSDIFFRTLWIPRVSRWSFYTNNHPTISLVDTKLACPINDICVKFLDNNISDKLLDTYSVKYIVVPIEDIDNEDDFFIYYGHSRDYYIKELDKLSYLKKINIGNGKLAVYKNIELNPHIFFLSSNHIQDVVSITKSTSQYSLPKAKHKTNDYLVFGESYHPDWKLRVGKFSWIKSLVRKDFYYPEKYHIKTESGLNAWKIDREWFKNQSISSDQISMMIYFAPQAWVNIGFMVSSLTVILLLFSLVFLITHHHEK